MTTHKLSINGKEYSLLFGYTCYKLTTEKCFLFRDSYLTEEGNLTYYGLASLFHCAYQNYCMDKNVLPEVSYDHFLEWVLDRKGSDEAEIAVLLEAWAGSVAGKKTIEEGEKKSIAAQSLESQTSTISTGS